MVAVLHGFVSRMNVLLLLSMIDFRSVHRTVALYSDQPMIYYYLFDLIRSTLAGQTVFVFH